MVAVRRAHVEFRYGFAEHSPTTRDRAPPARHAAGPHGRRRGVRGVRGVRVAAAAWVMSAHGVSGL